MSMRFAMHGRMFSGKSTLAVLLHDALGFEYLNYTDHGKAHIARALSAMLGRTVTHEEVIERKNEPSMRDFTIAGLRLFGFDRGAGIRELVESYIDPDDVTTPLVFDNVRYPAQYALLKPYGFTLVRLIMSDREQERRASEAGMPLETLERLRLEESEQPLPPVDGEIVLHVDDKTPERLLGGLLRAAAIRLPTALTEQAS